MTEFDSNKHDRIYSVQIEDYQNVELIYFKNAEFNGTLTHSVWTFNRKGIRKESLIQKIKIPNTIAEKLISELNNKEFGNLKDCNEVKNCINGLDGTMTFFKAI